MPRGRDPRGRVVSVAYLAIVPTAAGADTTGRDVAWWPTPQLPTPLPFDHERIVMDGLGRLQARTLYAGLAFEFLADEFTLSDLQAVYEVVLGEQLDVRSSRRDLHAAGVIEPTGHTGAEGPGSPARLHRRAAGAFAVDAGERRLAARIAQAD